MKSDTDYNDKLEDIFIKYNDLKPVILIFSLEKPKSAQEVLWGIYTMGQDGPDCTQLFNTDFEAYPTNLVFFQFGNQSRADYQNKLVAN